MAKGDRNVGWPGFFRAFTVLCAIILLLSRAGMEQLGQGNQVLQVYEGLTLWAIPALFMLWGMTALEEGKTGTLPALSGLALPTFCALIFWGAVYAVAAHLLLGGALSWGGIWGALVSAARGNTYAHLWVLYPLIGLYLVHPVLRRFTATASRGEVGYFLGLCFVFANLLPVWSAFFPGSFMGELLQRLQVHLVLGWVGCYVGGWYLRHYVISRVSEFAIYIVGILGLVLTLAGDRLLGGGEELWRAYTSPNVVLTAAAFCTLFRYVLGISEERSRRSAVNALGSYAFGIYLIHPLWLLIAQKLGISLWSVSPVVGVPFFALILFALSAPFAWLLGLIPGVGGALTGR